MRRSFPLIIALILTGKTMKKMILILGIIWLIPATVIQGLKPKPSNGSRGTCTVTYIANEGFLIGTKNKKILVDALFDGIKGDWCDQPGDSVSNLMIQGIAPFDGNERLKLILGYSDISDRVIDLKSQDHPDTTISMHGMNIRAMRLKHGSWLETDSATG